MWASIFWFPRLDGFFFSKIRFNSDLELNFKVNWRFRKIQRTTILCRRGNKVPKKQVVIELTHGVFFISFFFPFFLCVIKLKIGSLVKRFI